MLENTPVFKGENLRDLLTEAHDFVVKHGVQRESSRGRTYSIGALTLVWQNPSNAEINHWSWSRAEANFYQQIFVEGKPENRPERLGDSGDYLFPYTYAARSRFWDGGWGSVMAVLKATQKIGLLDSEILASEDTFKEYLLETGEFVHLQVLLSVWEWIGRSRMQVWLQYPATIEDYLRRSRIDQLQRIITEIGQNPASRRAVTTSFVYPDLDQRLQPLQGIPPYQFFQLLPGEKEEPLHSFHVHRSLDAGQGVQLDFLHDYYWLAEAAKKVNRPVGTITITAGDFHVYLPSEKAPAVDKIEKWLMDVTDGYQAGLGVPSQWLQKETYTQNAHRIYTLLGEER
jgi:hypothetical protein